MHIFRKSENTNAFGAYSYFGVTPEGHIYHWLMILSAPLGAAFDPRTARNEIVGLTRSRDNISPASVDQFMADKLQRTFNGTAPTPTKRTTRRSYGQPWRGLLIEALAENGGYGGHRRGEGSPVSYNVALDYVTTDYDTVRTKMLKDYPETADFPAVPVEDWDRIADSRYAWAIEDAQRGVVEDNYVYCMMSPATSKQFGLPADATYDVGFSLEGRSGKHLCVTRFDGHDLSGVDLIAQLQDQTDDKNCEPYHVYTNQWCRQLLAMMTEWDECFTPRKASDEVMYHMASTMMQQCEEMHIAAAAASLEAARIQEWAERDVITTT